jgi:hypothetical protein
MDSLGDLSVDKEYRSMVVYLDAKEEVDRLFAKMTVTANAECIMHTLAHSSWGVSLHNAIAATFTAIYTTAVQRRLQSVCGQVSSWGMRHRHAP